MSGVRSNMIPYYRTVETLSLSDLTFPRCLSGVRGHFHLGLWNLSYLFSRYLLDDDIKIGTNEWSPLQHDSILSDSGDTEPI